MSAYNAELYQAQKEKRNRKKEETVVKAIRLKNILVDKEVWSSLPVDLQQFITEMCYTSRQFNQSRLLHKMFGQIKINNSVDVLTAMHRTLKGLDGIEKIIREAEEKGFTFSIQKNQNPLNTLYTILTIPEGYKEDV